MQFQASTLKRIANVMLILAISVISRPAIAASDSGSSVGFVYVMTNQVSGNSIVQFQRLENGLLSRVREVSTRGLGSGGTLDPLTSQDSLVLSGDGQVLLAVNAGSNEVSTLQVGQNGLHFASKAPSGGVFPNSVALNRTLVYVLNAKGTPNITAFRLNVDGTLRAIPTSTRNLPGGVGSAPADVRFSQDGTLILVTETATNKIDIFKLDDNGLAIDATTMPSVGEAPFGFNFATRGRPIVAEAGTASVSSYDLTDSDGLDVISPAVPDTQMASCWISLTNDKRYAYISNTASGTISSYQVDAHGVLTLLKPVAANTGSGSAPIDSTMSHDSKYLYVLNSTLGRVAIFSIGGANLTPIGAVSGLPKSIQGIAGQ